MDLSQIIDYLYPGALYAGLIKIGIDNGVYQINYWAIPNVPEPTVQELMDEGAAHELAVQVNTLKLQASIAIQQLIDDTAKSRAYADGVAAVSYANSSNPVWKAEGEAFSLWRDSVWAYCYTELPKFESGERPLIPVAQFIQELPQMQWPD